MVRALREEDWGAWSELWAGYLRFYRGEITEETTRKSFLRLCQRSNGMFGLMAEDEGGSAVGLAHAVVHPSTWSDTVYCYLEDLFVAEQARGAGHGRELVEAVFRESDALDASRVYWHTQEFNGAARSLYDQVGHRTSFVVYKR
jgi:GNAT superfamily N-acetyltransferase